MISRNFKQFIKYLNKNYITYMNCITQMTYVNYMTYIFYMTCATYLTYINHNHINCVGYKKTHFEQH